MGCNWIVLPCAPDSGMPECRKSARLVKMSLPERAAPLKETTSTRDFKNIFTFNCKTHRNNSFVSGSATFSLLPPPSVAKPKSSYSGMTSGIRYRLWNSNSWWYQVLQPLFFRLQNPFHFAKLPSNWSETALELLGAAQWNSILGVVATSRKGLNLSNLNKRLLIEAYSIQLLKPPRVWFHSGFGSEFEHVTTPSWHDPTAIPNQPKMALEPLYNSVNFSMINKKLEKFENRWETVKYFGSAKRIFG